MRGLVVEIKDDRAIILKDDGTFANIKNKGYKVGQRCKTSSKAIVRSLKIAACFALCILTSTIAYNFYHTPYSYIYIDINPSIRLDLNYFDIVINCTPLNDDAKFIEVSSGDVEESIDQVITKCEQQGFLNEVNNQIEINVSEENDKVERRVLNVGHKYQNTKYNLVVKNTTEQEILKANEKVISVKRQRVIEEFSSVFGGDEKQNAENLQDKTTKEIDTLISNKKKTDAEITVEVSEKREPASETIQPENSVKKPVSNDKETIKKKPVTEIPDKEIKKPKQEIPQIKEPEQGKKDEPIVAPEYEVKPGASGEELPEEKPKDKTEEKNEDKPVEENREPHAGNKGENMKEPEGENTPPEKEPVEHKPDSNQTQKPPTGKEQNTPMPSGGHPKGEKEAHDFKSGKER